MPQYKYKVLTADGAKQEGQIEAESKDAVMQIISSNQFIPLHVEEVVQSKEIEVSFLGRVKIKDIAIFCRQFYTMLDAGVTINNCLSILGEQTTNKKLKKAIIKLDNKVSKGSTLSDAMKEQDIFPDLLNNMVATGEMSGNLDSIMLRMSTYYEKEFKMNNKLKNAMIYPAVLGTVALGCIIILLTFVVPMFVDMFQQNGVELPLPTKILLGISGVIKNYWLYLLIGITGGILGLRYYFKTENGILKGSILKLKIPLLKGLTEKTIVARFTRTLATLTASGVPLIMGLEVVAEVVGNKYAEVKLLEIKNEVTKGNGLSEPLMAAGIFPRMLGSMVAIGEETGSLEGILNKTSDFYDEELDAQIQNFTAMLEPLMIVVMGVVIGFMVLSIMVPMFEMYNMIG